MPKNNSSARRKKRRIIALTNLLKTQSMVERMKLDADVRQRWLQKISSEIKRINR